MKPLNYLFPSKGNFPHVSFWPLSGLLFVTFEKMFKQNPIYNLILSLSVTWLICITIPAIWRKTRPKPIAILKIGGIIIPLVLVLLFAYQIFDYYRNPIEQTDIDPPAVQLESVKIPWWWPPIREINQLNNEGVDEFTWGNYDKAITKFQKGIYLNPRLSYLHNNLGCALSGIAKTSEEYWDFRDKYKEALKLKKDDPIPYENYILTYALNDSTFKDMINKALKYETRRKWKDWLFEQRKKP